MITRSQIGTFVLRAVPIVAIAALLWRSAPAWPDDWDGLGFVASIDGFDLDRFTPHPPGYPVYVALMKLASFALRDRVAAANAVSVASGLATFLLVRATTARITIGLRIREKRAHDAEKKNQEASKESLPASSARARAIAQRTARYRVLFPADVRAAIVAFAVAITPLVWRSWSGIGSEALALAFAALAAWGIALQAPSSEGEESTRTSHAGSAILVGVAVGLGLGARLSWAPLYLPMLLVNRRRRRLHGVLAACASIALWLVPMLLAVGPAHYIDITRAHFAGHAARWGGTALTDPGISRVGLLLRDVFVDGLGCGTDIMGFAIAILIAAVSLASLLAWRERRWRGAVSALIVFLPYTIWITLGQNLRQQPRHVLPLVVALVVALSVGASMVNRLRMLSAPLLLLVALRTGQDASERRSTPPAGAQLVEWLGRQPDAESSVVFGGTSIRFFERSALRARAKIAGTYGDVALALSKMNDYPTHVYVTSELEQTTGAASPPTPVASLCRSERLDRRAPCITVYELAAR